jgi:outer membrane receptor protein involved in Fe transport
MISYAALTTSLAAQEQTKVSPAARDARAQAQPDQSVSLPHIDVRRAKPQPRRRVAVRPAPAPAAPRPVVQAERGTGPVSGYTASQSVTATKTDTPILETPQSISIVTKDQATAQGAHTLTQALHYAPGVTLWRAPAAEIAAPSYGPSKRHLKQTRGRAGRASARSRAGDSRRAQWCGTDLRAARRRRVGRSVVAGAVGADRRDGVVHALAAAKRLSLSTSSSGALP